MGRLIWNRGDTFCLDLDAVIYAVERIEPFHGLLNPLWEAAARGEVRLVGSELLLLETLVKPLREGSDLLSDTFRQLLTNTTFELLPITRAVLERAAQLRAKNNIGSADAIHAATSILAGCTAFLSNDRGYLRVHELPL